MLISAKTLESLNRYVQTLFAGNAKIDNLYYNLKYKGFNRLADAIHKPVAHVMGDWADEVTDMMDENGVRPVRLGLPDEVKEYSVSECFDELVKYFDELYDATKVLIDAADMADDIAVKIFLEGILEKKILVFRKQAYEWKKGLEGLGDEHKFNIHIDDYTHYIK